MTVNLSYTCANCGLDFESDWTQEDAMAEATANGFTEADDLIVVCDDCHRQIMDHNRERGRVRER